MTPPGTGMFPVTGEGAGAVVGMLLMSSEPCWKMVTLAVVPPHSGPQLRT